MNGVKAQGIELTSKQINRPSVEEIGDGKDGKNSESSSKPFIRQLLVATGPIVLSSVSGLTSGYSAVLLPQLNETDSTIIVTEDEQSWIAALAVLPMILGCLLAGWAMEVLGRKTCLMYSCIPFSIGWILFCFAQGTPLILVGRFITGTICGYLAPPCTVYIGETAAPKYRGLFLAGLSLGIAFGVLWAHVMGTFLSWRIVGGICGIVPIACMIQMIYVPESPVWLAKKNKTDEARTAFYWIRESTATEKELQKILDSKEGMIKRSLKEYFSLFTSAVFIKPFLILSFLMTVAQWSGNNAITFYTVTIVQSTIGNINEYMCMIIVDVVRMVISILSCYLIEKLGRRMLTFVSGYGSAATLLALALVSYLSEKGTHIPASALLILLAGFMAFVTVGLVPIPWSMLGEIFPIEVRDFGSGITSVVSFSMMFGVVKTGLYMFNSMGSVWTYIFYGSVCLVGSTVLVFIMPETKGKILQDIEEDMKKPGLETDKEMA